MAGTQQESPARAHLDAAHVPPNDSDPHGLVGRVVDDRYLVERVIGQGGFGVVYLARHVHLDSRLALKVMRIPSQLEGEARAEFVDRFLHEGRMLFQLSALHTSIVRVFEAGLVSVRDGRPAPYLALEWLEGQSLERTLQERAEAGLGGHALREVISLLAPAVAGLSAAHARRIAHRDIKPANIFLTHGDARGAAKLLDFGLAKAMGESTSTSRMFSESGFEERAFTPAYAAPEQWLRRLGATGPWTDVFALALVVVELLAGRRPVQGDDAGQLMAICLDASVRPTPRSLNVHVADGVERVLLRALAVDPRARFRDANAFWSALEQAAQGDDRRWLGGRTSAALATLALSSVGLGVYLSRDGKTARNAEPSLQTVTASKGRSVTNPPETPPAVANNVTNVPAPLALPTPPVKTVTKRRTHNAPRPAAIPAPAPAASEPVTDSEPAAEPRRPTRQEEMLQHDELTRRK